MAIVSISGLIEHSKCPKLLLDRLDDSLSFPATCVRCLGPGNHEGCSGDYQTGSEQKTDGTAHFSISFKECPKGLCMWNTTACNTAGVITALFSKSNPCPNNELENPTLVSVFVSTEDEHGQSPECVSLVPSSSRDFCAVLSTSKNQAGFSGISICLNSKQPLPTNVYDLSVSNTVSSQMSPVKTFDVLNIESTQSF